MLVEAADTRGEWDAVRFCHARNRELRLRHLQRITLGRTYPEMVARTAQVTRSGALASALRLSVARTWSIPLATSVNGDPGGAGGRWRPHRKDEQGLLGVLRAARTNVAR